MASSLVSYAKVDIVEQIPGLQIGNYRLAASEGLPTVLIVENSFYYKPDIDGNQDKVLVQSEQIAESIVHMHITSQLMYNAEQHPALFYIPSIEVEPKNVEKLYKEIVADSLRKQKKWFIALVKLADDDWQIARRHQMISGIQRIAARELGLTREWLFDIESEELKSKDNCPFCGSNLLDANTPICPHCGKVHNPERLKALEAMLASQVSR
jgi:hypothetical protein